MPLFCDAALAERIERVEAQLLAKATEAARRRTSELAHLADPAVLAFLTERGY